jgi:hypothetical protein
MKGEVFAVFGGDWTGVACPPRDPVRGGRIITRGDQLSSRTVVGATAAQACVDPAKCAPHIGSRWTRRFWRCRLPLSFTAAVLAWVVGTPVESCRVVDTRRPGTGGAVGVHVGM